MAGSDSAYITVGKIGSPFGVRGWVKVTSYTEQTDNLLDYDPWYLPATRPVTGLDSENDPGGASGSPQGKSPTEWRLADVTEAKVHGSGLVARFKNCDDRDAAALLNGLEIAIRRDQLPKADSGEYYWADLEGLEVKTLGGVSLGFVDHLLETGANDVLVVKGERERLIPYVRDHIVKAVDLEAGLIQVDWDPDYE